MNFFVTLWMVCRRRVCLDSLPNWTFTPRPLQLCTKYLEVTIAVRVSGGCKKRNKQLGWDYNASVKYFTISYRVCELCWVSVIQ